MFRTRLNFKKTGRDEAEKPFWISFSDLMTALMVLFLVVMGVALLAVTKNVTDREKKEAQHSKDIDDLLERFNQESKLFDGIKVDKDRRVIDFGDRARFGFAKSTLSKDQEGILRQFVPHIISLANDELGKRVLKRIVVEGYTDRTGTYLANLNLSLQRSQRVLCAMFATEGNNLLTNEEKENVRSLFFVGGYSFNAAKATDEESRRVEMRLEFLGIDEKRPFAPLGLGDFGECAIQ